jgi:hypothetical protein
MRTLLDFPVTRPDAWTRREVAAAVAEITLKVGLPGPTPRMFQPPFGTCRRVQWDAYGVQLIRTSLKGLTANMKGTFEIETHESNMLIGELTVS